MTESVTNSTENSQLDIPQEVDTARIIEQLAEELSVKSSQVAAAVGLLDEGATVPFIARYRKEVTGGLDDTVITLGRFPSETMPLFFEKADVMLVSLTDSPLFNMYSPAKIASYMAAERPIIAVLNGEGGEVIKVAECGWNVNAGDADSLAELVIKLSSTDKQELINKGRKGKEYYDNFFTKEKCLKKLDDIMGL